MSLFSATVLRIGKKYKGQQKILIELPALKRSMWARLTTLQASDGSGTCFLPDPGDEVVVSFLNNSYRYPVILGSLFNEKNKTPLNVKEDNSQKAIVSRNKMQIHFDDKKNILTISTQAGNKLVLSENDSSVSLTDENKNSISLNKNGITLNSQKDININAKQNIKINGLNINAKAKLSLDLKGTASAKLSASGNTTVEGSMVMIN